VEVLPSPFRESLIRLPRTGSRNAQPSFVKLLEKVAPDANTGFGFSGAFFQPGKSVPAGVLRPPGFPATPVVLECVGVFGGRGHVRGECLYILWQLDGNRWRELGRASSHAWEWSVDLGPLAARAIEAGRSAACVEVLPSLASVEQRIRRALDRELERLEPRDRRRVVAILHDELASRFAGVRHALKIGLAFHFDFA